MHSPKLSYRAEIDGLRAIAVVIVILYHAEIVLFGRDWFEGGYIGVDIFFVISGYLITRIILSELQTSGSFSFLKFYERRARRILPMLFIVIFVSIPFAWHKLLPSELVEYSQSIIASLFFVSNFFFYFNTTEYGADSALLKPFLHTWSLGVEEQFYLVFPIISVFAFKYFRAYFLSIVVVLCLMSLQYAELMEVRNSDLNFYLPFSRFWELAVGSALAFRELNYRPSDSGIGERVLPVFGLYLVAYGALFFDSKTPHPSFHTIVPVLGVALIIGFASKNELIGRILGSKIFVWIGLISYSAYLWHFPIFALSRINKVPTNYDKFEWIFITLILSIFSYFLVEKPFRGDKVSAQKFMLITFIFSAVAIALATYAINQFDYKNVEDNSRSHYQSILDKGAFLEVWRDQAMREKHLTDFDQSDSKKVLIVGNSHGIDFFRALSSSSIFRGIDFGLISQNRNTDNYQISCFYNYLVEGLESCGEKGVIFDDLSEKFEKADLIVLKTRWQKEDLDVVGPIIDILKKKRKEILIVGNAFEQRNEIVIREFLLNEKRLPNEADLRVLKKEVFRTAQHKNVNEIDKELEKLAFDKGVSFLSTKNLFCDYVDESCEIFTADNYLILWDYGHLTTKGAVYLGGVISEKKWGIGVID